MAIERQVGRSPGGFDYKRPNCDVRNEVTIHHVDMDQTCSAALSRFNIIAEAREIR